MLMFGEEQNRDAGSMEEDLKALKLEHLFESKKSDAAVLNATDAEAASPRTEVPVRQEGAGEQDYGATKASEPPADDKGGEEHGGDDESGEKPAPPQPPKGDADKGGEDGGDDEMKESIDAVLNMTEQDVDALDEDELEGALYVALALEDIAENPSPKLEAAFAVVDSFYTQLAEGETQTIDRETLVGVVEAMEYVLKDYGILGEMKGMGGAVARHAARAMAHGKSLPKGDMAHKVQDLKAKLGSKKGHFKKGLASFKPPAMHHGKGGKGGYGSKHEDDNSLSSIVGNLTALRDSLKENANAAESTGELAEGLKAVGETATAWYEAIAKEIKSGLSEGKQVEENDPRVLIGRHLEGIAADAAENLAAIESGEKVNTEAAEHNLRNLAADLNDAAEVMKSVE